MTVKLYELTGEFESILDRVEEEGFTPDLEAALQALAGPWKDKAQAVVLYVREQEMLEAGLKAEEDRMAARRKSIHSNVEDLKTYLQRNLDALGLPDRKLQLSLSQIAIRRNPPAVDVLDIDAVPREYIKPPRPQPPEVDKTAIANAWKAAATPARGDEPEIEAPADFIPGVRVLRGEHLEIK